MIYPGRPEQASGGLRLTQQHGGDALHDEGQPGRVHGVDADAHHLRLAFRELVLLPAIAVVLTGLLRAATISAFQALVLPLLLTLLYWHFSRVKGSDSGVDCGRASPI